MEIHSHKRYFHVDGLEQENVTPLLTHWSYVFPALTHRYIYNMLSFVDAVV